MCEIINKRLSVLRLCFPRREFRAVFLEGGLFGRGGKVKYEAVRILLGVEIHPWAAAAVLAAIIPRFDTAVLNQLEKGETILGTETYVSGAAV